MRAASGQQKRVNSGCCTRPIFALVDQDQNNRALWGYPRKAGRNLLSHNFLRRRSCRRDECQAEPVETMAFAGRLWTVIKDVTKMAPAAAAMHLGADLKDKSAVFSGSDCIWQAFVKARPARAAVVFRLCAIDGQVAPPTMIGAGAGLFVEWAGVWAFGLFFAQNEILAIAQTCTPFRFAAADLKPTCRGLKRTCHQDRA